MKSLREASGKSGFVGPVISARGVAQSLQLASPISLRALMDKPVSVIFETGEISAGDVSGWAQLGLLSNGFWSFRGHLHDSGTIFGDKYALVVALNFVDSSGNALAVQQEGALGGGVTGGSRDVDWQQDGFDPVIAENWNRIRELGITARLEVGPDIGQIVAGIFAGLATGLIAVGIIILATGGKGTKCDWEGEGSGVDLKCRREF